MTGYRIRDGLRAIANRTRRTETGYQKFQERVTYAVYLDYTEVEALAVKAARNKSGKSKDGPVQVVITGREEVA